MAHLKRSTGTITKQTFNSPVLTTPALGTPASGVMTNMTGAVTASIVNDAVTLAKMAGGTDGNIISYDASGDPVAIATGSDGQALTSTGSGSPPAMETIAAGVDIDDGSNATWMRIASDEIITIYEKLFINTTGTPNIPFGVINDTDVRHFGVDTNTTQIFAFGGWNSSWCDRRAKKNINSLTDMLPEVEKLNLVDFHWKKRDIPPEEDQALPEGMHYGVIAQEIQEIFPTLVYEPESASPDDMLHLQKEELVYIALQAIKELSAKNDALNVRALALESA